MLQNITKFILITVIAAILAIPHDIEPDSEYLPYKARIKEGRPITSATYAPCYTTIVVFLWNVTRICGGCVIAPGNKVLTAASCILSTYQNASATNMIFSFGVMYIPRLDFRMTSIAIPAGYSVSSNTSSSDVAVVTLNQNVTSRITSMKVSTLDTTATKDAFVGQELVACGFGVKSNIGIRPVFLNCVSLTVVSADTCFATTTTSTCATVAPTTTATTTPVVTTTAAPVVIDTTTIAPVVIDTTTVAPVVIDTTTIAPVVAAATSISPDGVLCTKNTDGRGVCYNDEGSPVFSNSTGKMVQVGVISYVANRNSSFCGTLVVISQIGSLRTFIDAA